MPARLEDHIGPNHDVLGQQRIGARITDPVDDSFRIAAHDLRSALDALAALAAHGAEHGDGVAMYLYLAPFVVNIIPSPQHAPHPLIAYCRPPAQRCPTTTRSDFTPMR